MPGKSPVFRNPHGLPTKVCAACGKPFTWRKKWARDWESVKYCSDRCRGTHPAARGGDPPATGG